MSGRSENVPATSFGDYFPALDKLLHEHDIAADIERLKESSGKPIVKSEFQEHCEANLMPLFETEL